MLRERLEAGRLLHARLSTCSTVVPGMKHIAREGFPTDGVLFWSVGIEG